MNSAKIGLWIKFTAKDGQRNSLAAHLTEVASLAHGETGTELWLVNLSPTDPNAVWLYEAYSDQDAMHAHEATAAYEAAKAKTGSFLAGPPEVLPLLPISGKGLAE